MNMSERARVKSLLSVLFGCKEMSIIWFFFVRMNVNHPPLPCAGWMGRRTPAHAQLTRRESSLTIEAGVRLWETEMVSDSCHSAFIRVSWDAEEAAPVESEANTVLISPYFVNTFSSSQVSRIQKLIRIKGSWRDQIFISSTEKSLWKWGERIFLFHVSRLCFPFEAIRTQWVLFLSTEDEPRCENVTCPPLKPSHCKGIIPPGACCPHCGKLSCTWPQYTVTEWACSNHIGSSRNASVLRDEANHGSEQNLKFTAASFVCRDLVLLPLKNSNKIVFCLYCSRGSSNSVHSKTAEEKQRRFQQARVRHARGSVLGSAATHLYCKYLTTPLLNWSYNEKWQSCSLKWPQMKCDYVRNNWYRSIKICHVNLSPTGCILLLGNVLSDTAGMVNCWWGVWLPWVLEVYSYARGIEPLPRVEKDRLRARWRLFFIGTGNIALSTQDSSWLIKAITVVVR